MRAGSLPHASRGRPRKPDHHSGRAEEVVIATLREAGVIVLERDHLILELGGIEVGVVGTKGFVGGFPGAEIPDFGEPLLREIYAETSLEVAPSSRASRRSRAATGGWCFSTTRRSATRSPASLPASGRSSARAVSPGRSARTARMRCSTATLTTGRPRGSIGEVPVWNVARHVTGEDFAVAEVLATGPAGSRQPPVERRMRQERSRLSRAASSSSSPRAVTDAEAPLAEVLERAPVPPLLDDGRADVRRAGNGRRVAELVADPAHDRSDSAPLVGGGLGGPCSAKASAASRVPPHVRKSFAV